MKTLSESDELKRLREENERLKLAYADLSMNHLCSQKVIELADEMFGLDLKTKYAQELSRRSESKSQ